MRFTDLDTPPRLERRLHAADPGEPELRSPLAGKRVEVILNAGAGALRRGGASTEARHIREILEQEGSRARVHVCSPPQVTRKIIETSRNPDVHAVFVGGGDGTISTAVHHLSGTRKLLGVLPLGTMNLLARELELPLSLEPALDALVHGRQTQIDAGEVNGRRFALAAILGIYPWVIRRRDQAPIHSRLGKIMAWLKVAPRALTAAPTLTASLEHDGGRERIRSHLVMIATGPTSGGVGPLLRREQFDTGRLFAYHARHTDRRRLFGLLLKAAVGPWPMSAEVDCVASRIVTIRSRRRKLPVALDGEVVLLRTPLRFRVLPGAIRVLVPSTSPA